MIRIGPHILASRVVLAPMAGVTDLPFRTLCKRHGAGLTPGEMITSNTALWNSDKNRLRRQHDGEASPRVVQIAGSDPTLLARAARMNVEQGAEIIDINMGCPAKKVLKKAAGSALLKDELLVRDILHSVVSAVDVPVTLKIRTGWCRQTRNGQIIARIAEDAGIASLAVHGRTRECMFKGQVEYDTIASIKENIQLPVFANGDISTPEKAAEVLLHTKADGVMIGRGAQGKPWLFSEIDYYLQHGTHMPCWENHRIRDLMLEHVAALHQFYGDFSGVRFARKHVAWYLQTLDSLAGENALAVIDMRKAFNQLTCADLQLELIQHWFSPTSSHRSIAA